MEGVANADLATRTSKLNLAQTRHIITTFEAESEKLATSIQRVRETIHDFEDQARSSIENYQRASQKRRLIMEPNLREELKIRKGVLLRFKECQTNLEELQIHCIAVDEMMRKYLKSLLEREATGRNA